MKEWKGFGRLTGLILRREKLMSPAWIAGLTLFSVSLAAGMGPMFDGPARQALALTLKNPGIVAMMGPVYGADHYTVGAMYANTMFIWTAIAVAVMNIFLVVRHTRAEEESGCREYTASLCVGRMAQLCAAAAAAGVINLVIGLLHGVLLSLLQVESMEVPGCVLYGASLTVLGLVFSGIAAVFCQLCSSSRGAAGASLGVLGAAYLLRALGDIGNETLSLVSPIGLMQRAEVFVSNRTYPVLLLLAEAAVFFAAAFVLNGVRDLGQGLFPTGTGKRYAPKSLCSPPGLAFRLLRGMLLAWLAVSFLCGAAYGSILGDIEAFVAKSALYQMIIGISSEYSVPVMFLTMVNNIMALLCTVPPVMAVLKLRSEETAGRLDGVLGRSVSRTAYLGCYAGIAFAAGAVLLLASALGLYAAARIVLDERLTLGFFLQSSLVYLPALWCMTGLAVLLVGGAPHLAQGIWAYYGVSFGLAYIGRMLNLPGWIKGLTPFAHIPQLPVEKLEILPLAVLTLLAAVLTAVGLRQYRRRDLSV